MFEDMGPFSRGYGVYGWLNELIPILVFVGIAFLIISWLRKDKSQSGRGNNSSTDILRERYARGEINEEEFNRMLDVLKKN